MNKELTVKNKKSLIFLLILAVFLIAIVGYYIFWKSVADRMKNIVAYNLIERFNKSTESFGFSSLGYDKIEISGFPFNKDVTIRNLVFSAKSANKILKQVNIGKMKASTTVFNNDFNVKLENIRVLDILTGESREINFEKEPDVKFSLYNDGRLKGLKYKDNGYKITERDSNELVYESKNTSVEIISERKKDKIEYESKGYFAVSDNVNLEENSNESLEFKTIPNGYTILFDISSTFFDNVMEASKEGKELEKFSIIFNEFQFRNLDSNFVLNISGNVEKDIKDPIKIFGDLFITMTGFQEFLDSLQESVISEFENSSESEESKKQQIAITKSMIEETKRVASLNQDTKDGVTALNFNRSKGEYDLKINGESLISVFSKLAEQIQIDSQKL